MLSGSQHLIRKAGDSFAYSAILVNNMGYFAFTTLGDCNLGTLDKITKYSLGKINPRSGPQILKSKLMGETYSASCLVNCSYA